MIEHTFLILDNVDLMNHLYYDPKEKDNKKKNLEKFNIQVLAFLTS